MQEGHFTSKEEKNRYRNVGGERRGGEPRVFCCKNFDVSPRVRGEGWRHLGSCGVRKVENGRGEEVERFEVLLCFINWKLFSKHPLLSGMVGCWFGFPCLQYLTQTGPHGTLAYMRVKEE